MADILHQPGVYAIRNECNGKMYIGSAISMRNRKAEHWLALRRDRHYSRYLQRAWNKHGEASFTFNVLEFIDDRIKLVLAEQKWMDLFHTATSSGGYNISPCASSTLGAKRSDQQIKEMSARTRKQWETTAFRERRKQAVRDQWANSENRNRASEQARERYALGEVQQKISSSRKRWFASLTEEQRCEYGKQRAGFKWSEEAKAKLRAIRKARLERERAEGIVRKHTPESKIKISLAKRKQYANEKAAGIVRKRSPEALAKFKATWAKKRKAQ